MSAEEYREEVPDDDEELYGSEQPSAVQPVQETATVQHDTLTPDTDSAANAPGTLLPGLPGLSNDISGTETTTQDASHVQTAQALPESTEIAVDSRPIDNGEASSTLVTTAIESQPQIDVQMASAPVAGDDAIMEEGAEIAAVAEEAKQDVQLADGPSGDVQASTSSSSIILPPPGVDREFFEVARANRGNDEAEFEYDSSDDDSSDSDSSDSSNSDSEDSDADGDYEMLDPATAARMLMAEEGGDDEEGASSKAGNKASLRTKNEQTEVVIPKPDVTITEAMRLIELGSIENVVENLALIKGSTSGEYQVLESGSVLCLADRTVIGAVAETFGRVQEPLYSVAFTNSEEADALGIKVGVKIFYVAEHSTFVFTQPLRNLKGTDASNIHDEEIGEDEVEFSDDEAERAHKQAVKQAKRNLKHGGRDTDAAPGNYHAANSDRRIISYDDDEGTAGQDNAQSAHDSPFAFQSRGSSDRGRGRGRDRGRGRGYSGRGDRGRGGRGGYGGAGSSQYQSPAQAYNSGTGANNYGAPATHPQYSQAQGYPAQGGSAPYSTPPAWNAQSQAPQGHAQYPAPAWPYQPGQGNTQYTPQQAAFTPPPPPQFQQGAHFNPAFWAQQLQQSQQMPQAPQWPAPAQYNAGQQQQAPAWPAQGQQGQAPGADVQAILQHMEMLRRMNGGQQ